jgi:hypothetical protein
MQVRSDCNLTICPFLLLALFSATLTQKGSRPLIRLLTLYPSPRPRRRRVSGSPQLLSVKTPVVASRLWKPNRFGSTDWRPWLMPVFASRLSVRSISGTRFLGCRLATLCKAVSLVAPANRKLVAGAKSAISNAFLARRCRGRGTSTGLSL